MYKILYVYIGLVLFYFNANAQLPSSPCDIYDPLSPQYDSCVAAQLNAIQTDVLTNTSGIVVCPIPNFSDVFTIQLFGTGFSNNIVEMFDLAGKMVFKKENVTTTTISRGISMSIDISQKDIRTGIYVLRCESGDKVFTRRISVFR